MKTKNFVRFLTILLLGGFMIPSGSIFGDKQEIKLSGYTILTGLRRESELLTDANLGMILLFVIPIGIFVIWTAYQEQDTNEAALLTLILSMIGGFGWLTIWIMSAVYTKRHQAELSVLPGILYNVFFYIVLLFVSFWEWKKKDRKTRKIEAVGVCETGLRREINQDAVFWAQKDEMALAVVADGMGGHEHGEIASRLVRQTIAGCWDRLLENRKLMNFQDMVRLLQSELKKANQQLFRTQNAKGVCGSTFAVLLVWKSQYAILSAGDSRIYLKRKFSFSQITVDEVWENQVKLPEQMKKDIQNRNRGKLVNAFGTNENLSMQAFLRELKGGELFLLCSDGLYKMCSERQIYFAMRKAQKNKAAMRQSLLKLKLLIEKSGAKDNYSVIMLKIPE